MGLTIHWDLRAPTASAADIRKVVEQLRQAALDLPFEEVSDIIEVVGADACNFEKRRAELSGENVPEDKENLFWFLIQSGAYVKYNVRKDGGSSSYNSISVTPIHVIGFHTWPGPGCEPMNISFALYPESVEVHTDKYPYRKNISTRLRGWRGGSFCKTQYASNPNCGGAPNFIRCHGTVIAMLDKAKELGVLKHVSDEGDFWKKRNVKALVEEVGNWNGMIASFFGALKDATGGAIVAPITEYPDFEHLEAKGAASRGNLPQLVRQMKKVIDKLPKPAET